MVQKAEVHFIYEEETGTAQYVVADPTTRKAMIIDSVLNMNISTGDFTTKSAKQLIKILEDNNYELQWILETHIHADHVTASHYLKTKFPNALMGISEHVRQVRKLFAPRYDQVYDENNLFWDKYFVDGEVFDLGDFKVHVIGIPGHTPADLGFYIEDDSIFTGDSVFMPDVGTARCDFPGGSAETLWASIQKLKSKITKNTRIYVGHDYGLNGKREIQYETSLDHIISQNVHLNENVQPEQFIEMRKTRDATLGLPRLFHASIQINIMGGQFPVHNGRTGIIYPVALID